ncbi:MAG: hypothetical protein JXA07_10260 [Spirochaetes bacterium]|nr:hypothetical protein [Spirochaetota bacterium]
MNTKHSAFAAALAALCIVGCYASLEDYPKEKCTALPNENVVKAIHDNCIKCHTKDFTTAQDICVRKGMIIDSVKSGRMPKMGKLYDHYRDTILNWK